MTDMPGSDDEYERLKEEIGWYSTWEDVVFWAVLTAAIVILVVFSCDDPVH